MDAGTNGTLYFDDFESRRFSYIGTLTDPGVDDPQASNQAGWFARTYQYSATIPHAVTSVNPETGSADTYSYDANGNMTCRVENGVTFKQDYNAENRISAIHKMNGNCSTGTVTESWLYAYDGDGVRVVTAHYTGVTQDSLTSYYLGGAYEVTGASVKKYYSLAGQTIMRDSDGSLKYLLTDHLGSTSAVVDGNGTLLSQQRYLPFGEVRADTNPPYVTQTDFGYTFQRNLSGTGLMDYRARFYSVSLGRFIQPDSIIPSTLNPQSWNRYSYVLNQPINFNDPSGHYPTNCGPDNIYCGGLAENDYYHVPAPGQGGGNGGGGNDECDDLDCELDGGSGGNDGPGHDYSLVNPVCLDLPWINCTDEEVADYMSRFQYPGQWPWSPVEDETYYNVAPAAIWGVPTPLCYISMCDSGTIRVEFGDNPLTISNLSANSHIFHVGDVVRRVVRGPDGVPYIGTRGRGTNDGYGILPGSFIDAVNQFVGPPVFDFVDAQMLVYTTVAETLQYVSTFVP